MIRIVERQLEHLYQLKSRQIKEEVRSQLKSSLEAVVKHFVIAGADQKRLIELEAEGQSLRVSLADGRTPEGHCSTGQRAQLALAWLLATNALIRRWLPHRLLLLDDVTTALDLTNLASECALLRKFAYTTDPNRKRQVVIASHHDQLTNRLFDLLIPPQGFTMREIRLVDWTLETGPDVEQATIKRTKAATADARTELAKRLGAVFRNRRSGSLGR